MKLYRKRTPVIEAVLWTGDNVDEIKEFCPDATIDGYGKLWIPAIIHRYCAKCPSFIVKDPDNQYPYRAWKPDDFNNVFEEVSDV